ncbi:hypothetical protein GALMADRAFT_461387 [Galerina marginata CBS 339.88]|uniref:Uncharacterized protein n=1 Tax=Galerina marginata (strain CBS 339.88) TaxID=685588 RepID=A0A067T1A5_GALM3|nr:hypothetical protein GALMADRAFT_461387 [Galerina marginata CBS 339.88]
MSAMTLSKEILSDTEMGALVSGHLPTQGVKLSHEVQSPPTKNCSSNLDWVHDLTSNYPARRARAEGNSEIPIKTLGKTVSYTPLDVPDPPSVSPTNVDGIASIWDDSSAYWRHYSPMKIGDDYVPMKLWRETYRRLYPGCEIWDAIKQNWWNCFHVMEEYHRIGREAFWAKRSTLTGTKCSTNTILKSLKTERRNAIEAEYAYIVKNASSFKKSLSYQKKGSVRPIRSKSSVVRRYREQNRNKFL